MQVFYAPLMQNRMCLLQWSTRPKKNSESSAAIQIYVPEPRHPFPMSLCKKITFLSYKLTGIIAVEEASASCCTLKLWVACCQMEPAAPLSGPVLGKDLSDERQVTSAYGGICRVHGARSLLVWPATSRGGDWAHIASRSGLSSEWNSSFLGLPQHVPPNTQTKFIWSSNEQ